MKIYTYADPYKLKDYSFWHEIKMAPNLCVSQTLVQGLTSGKANHYRREDFGFIYTLDSFLKTLYKEWANNPENEIKQYTSLSSCIAEIEDEKLKKAFKFNQREAMSALRMLTEMNIEPESFDISDFTKEQIELLKIYKKLLAFREWCVLDHRYASISQDAVYDAFDQLLSKEIKNNNDHKKQEYLSQLKTKDSNQKFAFDKIVIHGVHRFNALTLKFIKDLEHLGIEIIFVINYVNKYPRIFETWQKVYSWTNTDFVVEGEAPIRKGNLGEAIGELLEGNLCEYDFSGIQFTKFDNLTAFCDYVSNVYKTAAESAENLSKSRRISRMNEQFYAANNEKVNELLKQFHPEQFDDRHFLAYPIGQFILSLYQMWDSQEKKVVIEPQVLKECLSTGFFYRLGEPNPLETYRKMEMYYADFKFDEHKSFEQLIDYIDSLYRNVENMGHYEQKERKSTLFRGFSLYNMSLEELRKFKDVLIKIEGIIKQLFGFQGEKVNFKEHYRKLIDLLSDKNVNHALLGQQEKEFLDEISQRIDDIESSDIEGSVDDLKASLHFYLNRKSDEETANWIVRNFEQLDGGVLLSKQITSNKIYHIALVGDQEMKTTISELLDWPLDEEFFGSYRVSDCVAHIITRSLKEYRNFLRYSLFYVTYYLDNQIQLSFIENNGDDKNKPYFILNMLGLEPDPFDYDRDLFFRRKISEISNETITEPVEIAVPTNDELMNYTVCDYRFILDDLLEKESYFENDYLQKIYYEVLLLKRALELYQGDIEASVVRANEGMKRYFFLWKESDFFDVQNKVIRQMKNLDDLDQDHTKYLEIRKKMLYGKITEDYEDDENLIRDVYKIPDNERFVMSEYGRLYSLINSGSPMKAPKSKKVCQFCKQREICLVGYREGYNS